MQGGIKRKSTYWFELLLEAFVKPKSLKHTATSFGDGHFFVPQQCLIYIITLASPIDINNICFLNSSAELSAAPRASYIFRKHFALLQFLSSVKKASPATSIPVTWMTVWLVRGFLHWHHSAILEAYPVNFNARQPAASGSIYSGENYKAQSIQMRPAKLNTSLSDKQPVVLPWGNLQRGARLRRAKMCPLLWKLWYFPSLTHTLMMRDIWLISLNVICRLWTYESYALHCK